MSDDPINREWLALTRGKVLRVSTRGFSLANATSVAVVLRKPETEGTPATVITANVIRDPADPTAILWTVLTADLDTPGLYQIRARATFPGGITRISEIPATFEVIEP